MKKHLQIFIETGIEAERARTLRDLALYEKSYRKSSEAEEIMAEAKEIFTRLEMPLEIARTFL